MIFMTHPEHGATNVQQAEVEAHEKLGWKQTSTAEWLARKNKPVQPEPPKRVGRTPKAK